MAEGPALAHDWESCASIRNRFRREGAWVQWPVLLCDTTGGNDAAGADGPGVDDEGEEMPKRPVCTKALEMNVDALLCMVDAFHGNFIDIYKLQAEALHMFIFHFSL